MRKNRASVEFALHYAIYRLNCHHESGMAEKVDNLVRELASIDADEAGEFVTRARLETTRQAALTIVEYASESLV